LAWLRQWPSDDTMTGLDPENNQQTLQQQSATELATVVPITIPEDFLWTFVTTPISTHFPELL